MVIQLIGYMVDTYVYLLGQVAGRLASYVPRRRALMTADFVAAVATAVPATGAADSYSSFCFSSCC